MLYLIKIQSVCSFFTIFYPPEADKYTSFSSLETEYIYGKHYRYQFDWLLDNVLELTGWKLKAIKNDKALSI